MFLGGKYYIFCENSPFLWCKKQRGHLLEEGCSLQTIRYDITLVEFELPLEAHMK